MAIVAQLVRALDCGSSCRGFETRRSPSFSIAISFGDVLFKKRLTWHSHGQTDSRHTFHL